MIKNNKNGIIAFIVVIAAAILIMLNFDTVTKITSRIMNSTPNITIPEANEYAYNYSYNYVKKSTDFVPYSRQDIIDIFYSILDNGYESFTFYCPSEYSDCLSDVENISNNQSIITNIGNFVHPYNNFSSIKVATDSLGEVNIKVNRTYTKAKIAAINSKIDELFQLKFTSETSLEDKILIMHDYIVDNTIYDMNDDNPNSGDAYGALFDGKAKCAGYADAMAIILDKLGVQNYKVASEEHVWNAVYINNTWKHLDLTWDDPVVTDGTNLTDTIRHKFYMIDTPTLLSYDTKEHSFDTSVYVEVN